MSNSQTLKICSINFFLQKSTAVSQKNLSSGFPTRSDTNQAVQPLKMVRNLKFWNLKIEGLYYLCSENKGADQLRSYCTADQQLCFCIYAKSRFSHDMAQFEKWQVSP